LKAQAVGRPFSIRFRATVEHCVFSMAFDLFLDADAEGNGALTGDQAVVATTAIQVPFLAIPLYRRNSCN
jgi:hypothetical protein